MSLKKVITTFLASSMLLVSATPVASASETPVSDNVFNFPTQPNNNSEIKTIGGTFLVKAAVKTIINNKSRVVSLVRGQMGKRAGDMLDKHYSKVVAEVKPLLQWSDIPAQAVYDAVYRGMINAGVARSTATNVALGVKTVLNWLV